MTDPPDDLRGAFRRGGTADVLRMAGAEVARARAAGDPAGEVEGLYAMARVALRGDDLPRAGELARSALEVAVRAGDRRLEERPRHVLAAVARLAGDWPAARERYLAGIALNEELGQPEQANSERYNLAFVELHLGNRDEARQLIATVRAGRHSLGPYLDVAAAALASADGDQAGAARLVGAVDRAFAAIGQVPDPDDAAELSRIRAAAVAALGEAAFAREHAAG
ncbi:tetratricopeptide repeat protein [Actinoplanes sp. NPDC026619]|uniref:tetratricopeptide repeat protein n=1 Tax=Actinoplanes sp. NPDC026619 TaxID=3155798 RepID=UPI0033E94333